MWDGGSMMHMRLRSVEPSLWEEVAVWWESSPVEILCAPLVLSLCPTPSHLTSTSRGKPRHIVGRTSPCFHGSPHSEDPVGLLPQTCVMEGGEVNFNEVVAPLWKLFWIQLWKFVSLTRPRLPLLNPKVWSYTFQCVCVRSEGSERLLTSSSHPVYNCKAGWRASQSLAPEKKNFLG